MSDPDIYALLLWLVPLALDNALAALVTVMGLVAGGALYLTLEARRDR